MTTSQINPNQLRPSGAGDDDLGPIVQVGADRRMEAVERLVSPSGEVDREHARRFVEYARAHRINLEYLWARLDRRERVNCTVLAVPTAGRTAMLFASRAGSREQVRPLAGVIDHASRRLAPLNVNLAQVLLDPNDSLEHEAFLAGGFTNLAVLSYMERPIRPIRGHNAPPAPPPIWPTGVTVAPYRLSMRNELLEVLQRSYEETLDCPGLQGHRTAADILEGHQASGLFTPSLWTILYLDGQPRGTLLLNPSADQQTVELVYLGLAKEARGRGLGTQLLRHGFALLRHRGEQTISLAVDENNAPAIALYRHEGFRPTLRRLAMIRPVRA